MLSYERTPQIERKAGQIESRCCKLSYEADKLNSGKDKTKEKPCNMIIIIMMIEIMVMMMMMMMMTFFVHFCVYSVCSTTIHYNFK